MHVSLKKRTFLIFPLATLLAIGLTSFKGIASNKKGLYLKILLKNPENKYIKDKVFFLYHHEKKRLKQLLKNNFFKKKQIFKNTLIHFLLKTHKKSISQITFLNAFSNLTRAQIVYGAFLIKYGETKKGISLLESIEKLLSPKHKLFPAVFSELKHVYIKIKAFLKLQTLYQKRILGEKNSKKKALLYMNLGKIYSKLKKKEKTYQTFLLYWHFIQTVSEKNFEKKEIICNQKITMIQILWESGKQKKAAHFLKNLLEKVNKTYSGTRWFYAKTILLAKFYRKLGKLALAESTVLGAIKNISRGHYLKTEAENELKKVYEAQKNTQKWITYLEGERNKLKEYPEDLSNRSTWSLYVQLLKGCHRLKNYSKESNFLQEAKKLFPKKVALYLLNQGKEEKNISLITNALKTLKKPSAWDRFFLRTVSEIYLIFFKNRGFKEKLLNLLEEKGISKSLLAFFYTHLAKGIYLEISKKKGILEVLLFLEEAIKLEPTKRRKLFYAAMLWYADKKLKAQKVYDKVFPLNSPLGEDHLSLGRIYLEKGLILKAKKRFQKALRIFKKDKNRIQTLKTLLTLSMVSLHQKNMLEVFLLLLKAKKLVQKNYEKLYFEKKLEFILSKIQTKHLIALKNQIKKIKEEKGNTLTQKNRLFLETIPILYYFHYLNGNGTHLKNIPLCKFCKKNDPITKTSHLMIRTFLENLPAQTLFTTKEQHAYKKSLQIYHEKKHAFFVKTLEDKNKFILYRKMALMHLILTGAEAGAWNALQKSFFKTKSSYEKRDIFKLFLILTRYGNHWIQKKSRAVVLKTKNFVSDINAMQFLGEFLGFSYKHKSKQDLERVFQKQFWESKDIESFKILLQSLKIRSSFELGALLFDARLDQMAQAHFHTKVLLQVLKMLWEALHKEQNQISDFKKRRFLDLLISIKKTKKKTFDQKLKRTFLFSIILNSLKKADPIFKKTLQKEKIFFLNYIKKEVKKNLFHYHEFLKILSIFQNWNWAQELLPLLTHPSWKIRKNTCELLGKVGEKASSKKIIHSLTFVLKNDSDIFVRSSAAKALGEMGEKASSPQVISALIETLKHSTSVDLIYATSKVLALLEAKKNNILDKLICLLTYQRLRIQSYQDMLIAEDMGRYARQGAAWALGFIAKKRKLKKTTQSILIKKLVNLLNDLYYGIRKASVKTLSMIGTPAISEVLKVFHSKNEGTRMMGCLFLEYMGHSAAREDVFQILIERLEKEPSSLVYEGMISALKKLDPQRKRFPHIESYSDMVTGCDTEFYSTIKEINSIHEKAFDFIPVLLHNIYFRYDSKKRKVSIEILKKIGSQATSQPKVIAAFLKSLKDRSKNVRNAAKKALLHMKPVSVKVLLKNLNQKNTNSDFIAFKKKFILFLINQINDKKNSEETIIFCIQTLGGIEHKTTLALNALSALIKKLYSKNPHIRQAAMETFIPSKEKNIPKNPPLLRHLNKQ